MIYFENYYKGTAGLNNHVIPYTFCISLSNFLDRDFYFDYEVPPTTPPVFATEGSLKEKFAILMQSPRSVVSDLVKIPNRRRDAIDRTSRNKMRIDDPWAVCMSDESTMAQFGSTGIKTFFTLGRDVLVREQLQSYDLIEVSEESLINVTFFYFLQREAKNALLKSVAIKYREDLEKLAKEICAEIGPFNSVHLRMGDFVSFYESDGFKIDVDLFRRYLDAAFSENDFPVIIATDGLEQKDLFRKLLPERKHLFIDELVFESYESQFKSLEFTDFGALTVIDQLVCAAGEEFVGTCRSTLTNIIHRLRQERWSKKDFNFFPDERVARLLDDDMKIVADGAGFFEWNRYTPFSEHYKYPAWMREWNYDLTSL